MFLTVTISMEAREVMSNWASLGKKTRGSISSRGAGPDVRVGSPNPSGGDSNCHCISSESFVPAVISGLRTSSGQMGLHWEDACAPSSSRSSLSMRVSSAGVREATGSSSTDSSKGAFQMSSYSSCKKGMRHLHRSWNATHIVLGGAPDCSAQCCKALVSTTVCSFLTSQMSLVPQSLHSSMKSHNLRLLKQDRVFHQSVLLYLAAGNLKPAACFIASPCTWALLSCPGSRDQSSSQQLGVSPFSARKAQTNSMELPIGSSDAEHWVLAWLSSGRLVQ